MPHVPGRVGRAQYNLGVRAGLPQASANRDAVKSLASKPLARLQTQTRKAAIRLDWRAILLVAIGILFAGVVGFGAVRRDRNIKGPRITGAVVGGTAEVLWAQQTHSLISVDGLDCRVVNVGLTVEIPGHQPYDVALRRPVPPFHLATMRSGATVAVHVDSENLQNVQLDFDRL
jgi:hypothetical protein